MTALDSAAPVIPAIPGIPVIPAAGSMSPADAAPLQAEIGTLGDLPIDRGVAVRIGEHSVAVFRLADDEVWAVDHVDPFTGVGVLARGIVGSVGDRPIIVSPLYKQRFDLRTGECLDQADVSIRTWDVVVSDGVVTVLSSL